MANIEKPAETPAPEIEAELPLPDSPAESKEEPGVKELEKPKPAGGLSRWRRFRAWYLAHKKFSIPLSALALLLLLLVVPVTRYPLAGLVLKKNFTLQVTDQTTNTPVSGASVSSGSASTLTDGNGKAKLRLPVGHHSISITKKYYQYRPS